MKAQVLGKGGEGRAGQEGWGDARRQLACRANCPPQMVKKEYHAPVIV